MNELILEGPIVIPSPNGRFRVKLQAGDDGSLLVTLFERDASDPNKWNTPIGRLSASKPRFGLGVVTMGSSRGLSDASRRAHLSNEPNGRTATPVLFLSAEPTRRRSIGRQPA